MKVLPAVLVSALVAPVALVAPAALACVICASPSSLTPAQQMINAGRVVLVTPAGNRWKPLATLKGAPAPIPDDAVPAPTNPPPGPKAVVLAEDELSKKWAVIGVVSAEHGEWLRAVAGHKRTAEMNEADWRARVAFHAPMLEHPEPLLAEIAHGEIARSPYAAMRTLKSLIDPKALRGWLADPARATRRSLYTLLLGIAGGADDVPWIDRSIDEENQRGRAENLSALLCARIELLGDPAVAGIEKTFLSRPQQADLSLTTAALLALSVQGNAPGAVQRERVVDVYRGLVQRRHPLAGFVALDLAEWQAWDVTPDYRALLDSDHAMHPGARFAITMFLQRSPLAAAAPAASR